MMRPILRRSTQSLSIPILAALLLLALPARAQKLPTLTEALEFLQANYVEPLDPERLFYNGVLGLRERVPWIEIYFPDVKGGVRLVHQDQELRIKFENLRKPKQVAPALTQVLDLAGGGRGSSGTGGGEYTVINGLLRGLGDPFTVFLTPAVYGKLARAGDPDMAEVGISVVQDNGFIVVGGVRRSSPAARAGIEPGERVLAIDGESTELMSKMEAVAALWGKAGSAISLRLGEPPSSERDVIVVRERGWAGVVEVRREPGDVLVVRLGTFDRGVAARVAEQLVAEIDKKRVKAVIIDFRENPGGFLTEGIELLERFLPKGVQLARVAGAYEARAESYRSEGRKKQLTSQPLIVLVDGQSASVTELCSRALQVHRRGLLVGRRTFGKGSVQSLFELSDGSALKMTVARYYGPDGRPIDRGIDPDLVVREAEGRDRPLEFALALLARTSSSRLETLRLEGRALLKSWKQEAK